MDGWSYLGAFRMAELRKEKRHNIALVFCNVDQLGFNLALLPAVSVPVCVGVRGPLTWAVGSNLCHLESETFRCRLEKGSLPLEAWHQLIKGKEKVTGIWDGWNPVN